LSVNVSGEISNFSAPRSGHWYFTLKDQNCQIRAAMFRHANRHMSFMPCDGTKVIVRARPTLYEPRGDLQLLVEDMQDAGEGALKLAFEKLKKTLQAEGLFDTTLKQSLPWMPRRLGIITSPTGAALRDILKILKHRFPILSVIIYPAEVQGKNAPASLQRALAQAVQHATCDVLIIGRGGGSLEDLQAFNDEQLARGIFQCPIPIISAVGHETDTSISDFVADIRAPTPSAAANQVCPDVDQLAQQLKSMQKRLNKALSWRLELEQQRLLNLSQRLRNPQQILDFKAQKLDDFAARLERLVEIYQQKYQHRLDALKTRLLAQSPRYRLNSHEQQLVNLSRRLSRSLPEILRTKESRLASHARALHALSPLATLERGFCLALDENNQLVSQSSQLEPGQTISLCFAADRARVSVIDISDKPCFSD